MTKKGWIAALATVLLLVTAIAAAQKAVFVVRHGEKISNDDERLSEAGKARGQRLAKMLADARVAAVYSTDTERTLGTARPLAEARRLRVTVYDEPAALAEKVRAEHGGDAVLVVGHSNTVPDILKAFGCAEPVTIAAGEYDNLFFVVRDGSGSPALLRLRY
jgi:broad specificity phosphatase PhoE